MPAFDPTTTAIVIVCLMAGVLGLCGFLTLSERKISAWMQDRLGPNRVGPFGLLQPLADGGKFFLKEEVIPSHVDKVFYVMAPAVAVGTALLALAVVPFGPTAPAPDPVPVTAGAVAAFEQGQADYQNQANFVLAPGLDVGVLYLFAVGSLAVYGVVLAGWSANNKYSLLGALRASAQIISYEIPLGMAVLGVFLIVGSLNPEKVIAWQTANGVWWLIVFQPLALLLFMTAQYAEANRLPFDLPEAEQELVGGYHTEYSALKLGLMLLSEYVHLVAGSFMLVALFLGGWSLFGLEGYVTHPVWAAVAKTLIFCGKMFALVIFAQFVRWTIPRFRFDQLMNIAWKAMIPLALLNLLCVMAVKQLGWPLGVLTGTSVALFLGAGVLSVRLSGSVTNPKRKVVKLPPGLPAGVTYAS
jgi:NADH-quinone oxidoreductase subunit H